MYGNSEQTFLRLMTLNRNAVLVIAEIAMLDAELEKYRHNQNQMLMMEKEILRIEELTAYAGRLAAEIDGGNPSEHASWLSYNVQKLFDRNST